VTIGETKRHTIPNNLDVLAQLARLAFDLNAVVEEFFEISAVKNAISSRFRVVDDEFVLGGSTFGGGSFRLDREDKALAY
jgi:hypothetical protein